MKLKGQLQWTDYLKSSLLHLQPTGLARIMLYIILFIIVCALIGTLYLIASSQFPIEILIPVLIFVAFIALYRYVFLPNRVKKIFFQQKELGLPFELEFSEAGMVASNELGNSTRPWANFIKWKEDKDAFLLYHSDVMYSIVPKRIFVDSPQIEAVKAYLINNGIPTAKTRATWGIGCVVYIVLILAVGFILAVGYRSEVP